MKRNIFRSPDLQDAFISKGYVKVNLPDKDILHTVLREIQELQPDDQFDPITNKINPFSTLQLHCTFLDTNKSYKQKAQDIMMRYFKPLIDEFLIDYNYISGNIFVKQPGQGHLHLHQNWSVTEYLHTCLTLWIPLHDVDEQNGTLQVVEGSHKITPYIPTPEQGDYFNQFTNQLLENHLKSVPVKFGEAVIFCESLIHGSPQNNSSSPRTALQIAVYPTEEQPVIFKLSPDKTQFLKYAINPDFFVEHSINAAINPTADMNIIGSIPNNNYSLTYPEFLFRMEHGPQHRNKLYNDGVVSVIPFSSSKDGSRNKINKTTKSPNKLKRLLSYFKI